MAARGVVNGTNGVGVSRVAIGGASGMIGGHVAASLVARGVDVRRLVRTSSGRAGQDIWWNPDEGLLDARDLEGLDAVLHFGGRAIDVRWTDKARQEIHQSRVRSTRLLADTIARMERRPRVLLVSSAIGYYGDRDDEVLDESSSRGHGFLADLVVAWEAAAEPAARAGVRVVQPRFGIVLSPEGGVLARMLPVFRVGAGGTLGSGRQWWSWVTIDDVVRAVLWLLEQDTLDGGINVTTPNPVTNGAFTEVLGRVLRRPTVARVPRFALKLAFGEMADETMLVSQRVMPRRLLDGGFTFSHPGLEGALRHLLDA